MTLPVKVAAERDESVRGYFWRVATRNGYLEPKHLLSVLKLPNNWGGRRYFLRMIDDVLVHMPEPAEFWRERADTFLYQGEQGGAGIQDWWIEDVRICPLCLADGGYIRKDWEIPSVTVCPEHGTPLIHKCPECSEPLTWHHSLQDQCRHCGSKWKDCEYPTVQVPAYQQGWHSTQDHFDFRYEFTWALLQAYRPTNLDPDGAMRLDINLDILPDLCQQAWGILTKPSSFRAWQSQQITRFDSLRLNTFEWFDADSVQAPLKVHEFNTCNELLPRHQRNETSKADLEFSVKTAKAVKLLGIDSLWKVDMSQHSDEFTLHVEIREKVLPALAELGIEPVKQAKKPYWTRFSVQCLDAWVRQFQEADSAQLDQLVWLQPGSRLLELHHASYVEFINAGRRNELTLYRRPGAGISTIGVLRSPLFDWLSAKLIQLCETPVPGRALASVLGADSRKIQSLIENEVLTRAKVSQPELGVGKQRVARKLYLDNKSVHRYLHRNYELLMLAAMKHDQVT